MLPATRQRALQLELEARQHPPADAVNRLAVYAAQLERALTETRDELRQATGQRVVINGQVG
jgi:hypothetical protein